MSTFNIEGKGEMTYVDYYKKQYGIDIKDMKQPLLLSTPEKTSKSEENVLKTLALIPELCMLTGMSEAMRADFRVGPQELETETFIHSLLFLFQIMKEVGNFTRSTPQARVDGMRSFMKRIEENAKLNMLITYFGIMFLINSFMCAILTHFVNGEKFMPPFRHREFRHRDSYCSYRCQNDGSCSVKYVGPSR